ncbi:MAG: rhodanese [Pirellulales bacterium]|nr:rhodanese [Pirellulales bacterium]
MSDPAGTRPMEISCRETKALLDSGEPVCLIDCREVDESRLVSIAGTKLLPMSELASRTGELPADQGTRIVVHCHHGGRSMQVALWLRREGYAHAQSMAGGIDQWAVEIEPGMVRY